jgi:hypothetical protein
MSSMLDNRPQPGILHGRIDHEQLPQASSALGGLHQRQAVKGAGVVWSHSTPTASGAISDPSSG